ncbi:MAG: DUF6528 family protein [Bacteroidota bacterium]
MKNYLFILCLSLFTAKLQAQTKPIKAFLVCGDYKVLLVDYTSSKDSIPHIIWSWDAQTAVGLPDDYRTKFKSVDDCKSYGDYILVSSSSGAVAVVNRKDNKTVFYADAAMAHSVEMLPGGLLAVAASTHVKGNKLFLFDIKKGNTPIYSDTLYSGHGVIWDKQKQSLFALGYSDLREYKLNSAAGTLSLKNQWKIPGKGGHDLQMAPDGKRLFLTSETNNFEFNLGTSTFSDIQGFKNVPNVKSVGQNTEAQFIYTIPEQSWWTFHVKFANPARSFAFPDMKVYKARWYN